ncbi:hypothetical protein [Flavobacterium sp.]
MNKYTEELLKEDKEEIVDATPTEQADNNEFIDHTEVLDIFLKWDRCF